MSVKQDQNFFKVQQKER